MVCSEESIRSAAFYRFVLPPLEPLEVWTVQGAGAELRRAFAALRALTWQDPTETEDLPGQVRTELVAWLRALRRERLPGLIQQRMESSDVPTCTLLQQAADVQSLEEWDTLHDRLAHRAALGDDAALSFRGFPVVWLSEDDLDEWVRAFWRTTRKVNAGRDAESEQLKNAYQAERAGDRENVAAAIEELVDPTAADFADDTKRAVADWVSLLREELGEKAYHALNAAGSRDEFLVADAVDDPDVGRSAAELVEEGLFPSPAAARQAKRRAKKSAKEILDL